MRWRSPRGAIVVVLVGLSAACTGALGLDAFTVGDAPTDGGGQDASGTDAQGTMTTDAGSVKDSATSDVAADAPVVCIDPVKMCYQCPPTQDDQFLTSCGPGTCQPFDRSRILGLLYPDGALPPLPDGG
jgi:hypothetical protein